MEDWIVQVQEMGCGEILLNSIDNDGQGQYDCEILDRIKKYIKVPLIICGGVGENEHFEKGLEYECVDAVAAEIFSLKRSIRLFSKTFTDKKYNIREPFLFDVVNK